MNAPCQCSNRVAGRRHRAPHRSCGAPPAGDPRTRHPPTNLPPGVGHKTMRTWKAMTRREAASSTSSQEVATDRGFTTVELKLPAALAGGPAIPRRNTSPYDLPAYISTASLCAVRPTFLTAHTESLYATRCVSRRTEHHMAEAPVTETLASTTEEPETPPVQGEEDANPKRQRRKPPGTVSGRKLALNGP